MNKFKVIKDIVLVVCALILPIVVGPLILFPIYKSSISEVQLLPVLLILICFVFWTASALLLKRYVSSKEMSGFFSTLTLIVLVLLLICVAGSLTSLKPRIDYAHFIAILLCLGLLAGKCLKPTKSIIMVLTTFSLVFGVSHLSFYVIGGASNWQHLLISAGIALVYTAVEIGQCFALGSKPISSAKNKGKKPSIATRLYGATLTTGLAIFAFLAFRSFLPQPYMALLIPLLTLPRLHNSLMVAQENTDKLWRQFQFENKLLPLQILVILVVLAVL